MVRPHDLRLACSWILPWRRFWVCRRVRRTVVNRQSTIRNFEVLVCQGHRSSLGLVHMLGAQHWMFLEDNLEDTTKHCRRVTPFLDHRRPPTRAVREVDVGRWANLRTNARHPFKIREAGV